VTPPGARDGAVFVGDVALDEFFRTDAWPGSGEKVDVTPIGSHVGGMIANAAAVHAGYGDPTRFIWSMNDSALSRSLLEDLEAQGIDTSLVVHDAALADSRNIIVLAQGEHTVLTPALGLATIQLTDRAFAALCAARYVYTAIGDLRSLRHGTRGARAVIDGFRSAGALLVLDLDVGALRPGDEDLVGAVDIVLANRLGFERLRGPRSEAETVAALLAGAASIVVVTLGPDGCRVFSPGGAATVPGLRVDPVDVTGAGDTFGASFIHALGATDDPVAAATFANAAAARAVTLVGGRAGVATEADVRSFARQHGLNLPNSPPSAAAPAPPLPAGSPPSSERQAR
jgi:ribokinase